MLVIDARRLMERHSAMATFGATGHGDVNRPALSEAETAARRALLDWAAARAFTCSMDRIGNIFVRRQGRSAQGVPIRIGSHLDSQMPGGNYDGVYGVLAAFEVLETLEDQAVDLEAPVEVVVWNNEEGCRFSPTTMGSAVHAGALSLDAALSARDDAGITVREALEASRSALGPLAQIELGSASAAYLEVHIEQGPVLESLGHFVGIVRGIQGIAQFVVVATGEEAHAGTTPRAKRRDALRAAIDLIQELSSRIERDDDVRFTVGKFDVAPATINTVPARVAFTIDLRHPSAGELKRLAQAVLSTCENPQRSCKITCRQVLDSPPVQFDEAVTSAIAQACEEAGLAMTTLPSGATHDAKHMAALCPAGMIFIPCRHGISHSEREHADPQDMVQGANVLLASVLALADHMTSGFRSKRG